MVEVRGTQRWRRVRGAIDSSFNLVATHPSSRPELWGERGRRWRLGGGGGDALGGAGKKRRGRGEEKRKKKDLTAKGWQRRVPGFGGAG